MKKAIFAALACVLISTYVNAQYVGSKNSNKYHSKECQWAKRISESNLVTFATIQEAAEAGYQPCKVCKPSRVENSKATSKGSGEKIQKQTDTSGVGRCQAITKKGTQCKRRAKESSRYCWQHQRQ